MASSICRATAVQKSNRFRDRARRAFCTSSRASCSAFGPPFRLDSSSAAADGFVLRHIDAMSVTFPTLMFCGNGTLISDYEPCPTAGG
jgi:hypothetical protein